MRQITSISKLNTIPNFTDGVLWIYQILNDIEGDYPKDYIKPLNRKLGFQNLSISDKRRYEFDERNIKVVKRIRIPQFSRINSMSVLKIDDDYFQVYNAYDFVDKDGFVKTDLSLERLEGDLDVRQSNE